MRNITDILLEKLHLNNDIKVEDTSTEKLVKFLKSYLTDELHYNTKLYDTDTDNDYELTIEEHKKFNYVFIDWNNYKLFTIKSFKDIFNLIKTKLMNTVKGVKIDTWFTFDSNEHRMTFKVFI